MKTYRKAVCAGLGKMDYSRYFSDSSEWKTKNIYLCGLDIISFGVVGYLKSQGKEISGIVDKNFNAPEKLFGTTIYPLSCLENGEFNNPWFVITAFKEKHRNVYREMISRVYDSGRQITVSNATEIRIDVSGICNLRCPSCHVGNHSGKDFSYEGRGFMEPGLFAEILDKIEREVPENPAVYLFTLGEPLLNPHIPEMVAQIHDHGWMAVLSSNLSLHYDWERLLIRKPEVLKVSVSGFTQEVYGATHKGGNIELVKKNMLEIHRLIEKYNLPVRVMVGYHIYTNNRRRELEHMREFCRELGFLFQPVQAQYFNMFKRTGYTPFTQEDERFIREMYDNPEQILTTDRILPDNIHGAEGEAGSRNKNTVGAADGEPENMSCRNLRDKLFLDYDGRVMLCELFHREAIFKKYLDIPLDEIQDWRKNHWICRRCREYQMELK